MSFAFSHRRRTSVLGILGVGAALFALASSQASAGVTAPPGFTLAPFAAGSGALNNPDDIVRLDGNIYVAFQNGVGSQGEPGPGGITTSTIVEYSDSGAKLNEWQPTGRIDGMGADPLNHVIYATANEDASSSFYVVNPYAAPASQLRHLTYNDPTGAISGGTDAVSVDPYGNIYISASNSSAPSSNAVLRAVVDSPSVGEVTVSKTFADNLGGVSNANNPGSTTTLALTDPDSNTIVPAASPRFANDFLLVSQADGQLIFATLPLGTPTAPSTLTQLTVTAAGATSTTPNPTLDDVRFARSDGGVLYVVDQGANAIYKVSGPFQAGQAFAAQPTDPSNPLFQGDVLNVNLENGILTPFLSGLNSPKGLLYVSPWDDSALPGPVGPTGPQGAPGPQGPTGPSGDGHHHHHGHHHGGHSTRRKSRKHAA